MRFIKKDGYRIWDGRRPDYSLRIENFRFKAMAPGIYSVTYTNPRTKERYSSLTDDEFVMAVMSGTIVPDKRQLIHLRKIARTSPKKSHLYPFMYRRVSKVNKEIERVKKRYGARFRAVDVYGTPFAIDTLFLFADALHYRERIGYDSNRMKIYKRLILYYMLDDEWVVDKDMFNDFLDDYLDCIKRGEEQHDELMDMLNLDGG